MSTEDIAMGVRGMVVRDALQNAQDNGSDPRSIDSEELAMDMLDCCQPIELFFSESERGPLWDELLGHINAWKGGVQ